MNGETVQLNAWLNPYRRKQYISIYKRMIDKHPLAMTMLFPDHEKTAQNHYKELELEYGTAFNWEITDPGDVQEMIHEKAYEFYESEILMEHNFHLSFLSNMYQVFEQQIRSFIYGELNHRLSPVQTDELANFCTNMGQMKKVYLQMNFSLEESPYWGKINVLSDIANTFKHGEGRSAKRLFNKHPEFFKLTSLAEQRVMDIALTTNSEIVFEIDKIDFNTYAEAIVGFWTDFPERLIGAHTFRQSETF